MIDMLDENSYLNCSSAVGLADTLHNLGIIDDILFDLLLIDIYEKYGETYGDLGDNDDL